MDASSLSNLNDYQLLSALKEALASGEQSTIRAITNRLLEPTNANASHRATEALLVVLDKNLHPDYEVDPKLVQLLLDAGASVAPPYDARPSALYLALFSGSPEVAAKIMDAGADVEFLQGQPLGVNGERKTMLVWAIEAGQTEAALRMLAAGVSPHGIPLGARPLQAAARFGNLRVAEELVRLGVDVNEAYPNSSNPIRQGTYLPSDTPLMEAAKLEDNPVLKFLLDHNANVNAKNDMEGTALHSITWWGHYGRTLAVNNTEMLLKSGADPNVSSPFIGTPLARVIQALKPREKVTDQRGEDSVHQVIKLLLKFGANPNEDPKSAEALLDTAIACRDIISVLLLLDTGIDASPFASALWVMSVEAEGELAERLHQILKIRGLTPDPQKLFTLFKIALESGDTNRVRLLIETGADVNAYMADRTPLHNAAEDGFADIVLILLEAGANPNARTLKTHSTPLMMAMGHGRERGERHHIPYPDRVIPHDPTTWAIEQDLIIVRALLQAGTDIEARKKNECTVLHLAAQFAAPPVLRLIIDAGADVHSLSDARRTPLLSLLRVGRVATVLKKRASRGLDPYHRSQWQMEPHRNELLQVARWDEAATHLLLAAGSDPLAKGRDQYSALALAVLYGTTNMVQMLIDAGAPVEELVPGGRTLTEFIFNLGRTAKAIEHQGFKFESFAWLKEELQRAVIGQLDLTELVPNATETLRHAMKEDVLVLRSLIP